MPSHWRLVSIPCVLLVCGSLFTSAPAVAAAAIKAETGGGWACSPIVDPSDPTTVELCGVISLPGGGAVRYYFEVGTSMEYGQVVPAEPGGEVGISPGEPSVVVRAKVSGLLANVTYHYRLVAVAVADGSTSYGADETFTTPPEETVGPLSVETGGFSCSPFESSNPELCGVISLPGGGPVRYRFEFGTSTEYGETVPAEPGGEVGVLPGEPSVVVRAKVTGLQPDITYHYRLVASADGSTSYGADATFTTPPEETGGPLSVETGGFSCSPFEASNPELCGVISLPGGGAVRYYFELGTSTEYGQMVPAEPGGEVGISPGEPSVVVRAKVSGLLAGVTYHYRLVAVADGSTSYGADGTFATPPEAHPLEVVPSGGPPANGTVSGGPPQVGYIPKTAIPPPKPLTKAQELARALKQCEKKPKRRRASCRRQVRRKYALMAQQGRARTHLVRR